MISIWKNRPLKPETIRIESIGELVVMHFGNTEIRLKYDAALKFAQMLRIQAKVSKRRVGDMGRHWSTMGILQDAEQLETGRF